MIFIALGANLPHPEFGSPLDTLDRATAKIDSDDISVREKSPYFKSLSVPNPDDPPFINSVIRVETRLSPHDLLKQLHAIEADFGRVRTVANAPRVLDLDLLAFGDRIISDENGLFLPHPRLAQRAFVLVPLQELAPHWVHPETGLSVGDMLAGLEDDQGCVRI